MAKATAAPSVRVEAFTRCQPKSSDPGTLACHAQLWVYDRWQGKLGILKLELGLDPGMSARWSQPPVFELGAQVATRTVDFELPKGQTAQLRSANDGRQWILWRLDLPGITCPMAAALGTDILAQPLSTPLRAAGWIVAARSARASPGVDFATTGPSRSIQTVLVRSDNTPLCVSAVGQLHIEPQSDDPYVHILADGTQILVALPLATIP